MERETVFIGFGSNVGDRLDFCDRAVTLLGLLPSSQLVGVSSLYETEPVNDGASPGDGWFLNGIVQIETQVTPHSLLAVCREIEQALGRDLDDRKGPRTLDLDILFYGSHELNEPDLCIPHPRLHQRRFVLVPMVELAPDWQDPASHRTMQTLLDEVPDHALVRRLDPQPSSRYGFRPSCNLRAAAADSQP